jgi:hypothetical protein
MHRTEEARSVRSFPKRFTLHETANDRITSTRWIIEVDVQLLRGKLAAFLREHPRKRGPQTHEPTFSEALELRNGQHSRNTAHDALGVQRFDSTSAPLDDESAA